MCGWRELPRLISLCLWGNDMRILGEIYAMSMVLMCSYVMVMAIGDG